MRSHLPRAFAVAALLALNAWGADGITRVDLRGWYTEATPSQCAECCAAGSPNQSCICLAATLTVSRQPPPVIGWAAPAQTGGNVAIRTAVDLAPNYCFFDRRNNEHSDGRLHLRLNVMLYRQEWDGVIAGMPTRVLIRPEVTKPTTNVVRIYIEPNP